MFSDAAQYPARAFNFELHHPALQGYQPAHQRRIMTTKWKNIYTELKKRIHLVQLDRIAKVDEDAIKDCWELFGNSRNTATNEQGL